MKVIIEAKGLGIMAAMAPTYRRAVSAKPAELADAIEAIFGAVGERLGQGLACVQDGHSQHVAITIEVLP